MYETLNLKDWVNYYQIKDDCRNFKAQEAIEKNWEPVGKLIVWENGLTGQFYQLKEETLKKIRGDL